MRSKNKGLMEQIKTYAEEYAILTFARECRDNITHSPDEWVNVLNVAEEYEKYVKEEKITNGIVTQDTEYIRSLYQEMSREHRI